jgi:hypothetical protein
MNEMDKVLSQKFINPYSIFHGIQMQIVQNEGKHNISNWTVTIYDEENQNKVQEWNKVAYEFQDNEFYFWDFLV